jgi:hypothetical protein
MAAEEHDIVARITRSGTGSTSTGALAAHLGRACGHVSVDRRVVAQGYRFYPEFSDEIPAFFNKRFTTGSTSLAVTLQGGVDADGGDDPFAECRSTKDAERIIDEGDHHTSLWLAKVTVGMRMLDVHEVAEPLFIAKHPNEFRAIAEELIGLGVLQAHACPMCSE